MSLWTDAIVQFVSRYHMSDILFALIFLCFAFGLLTRSHSHAWSSRLLYGAYLIIVLVSLVAVAAAWYVTWAHPECSGGCRLNLPPTSNYYFNEILARTMSVFAFHAAVGLLGGIGFSLFARATKGRIIDQLDVDLLTVGGMVAGWPNVLIFYGLAFAATILITIIRAVVQHSAAVRMIVTPTLPFAAAVVVLFGDQLAHWVRLYNIGFTLR